MGNTLPYNIPKIAFKFIFRLSYYTRKERSSQTEDGFSGTLRTKNVVNIKTGFHMFFFLISSQLYITHCLLSNYIKTRYTFNYFISLCRVKEFL